MQVKIQVRGIEKVQSSLRDLPRGVVKVGLNAIGDWFVGTDNRGLRHYPSYRHVSRKRAYGMTFSSEKQRRWFFANGGADMIGNHRTGNTKNAWKAVKSSGGYKLSLQNNTPGAYYTMSDKGQARQPAMVGWRKVSEVVKSNLAGALRHALAAVNAYIKGRK
jgi:hypothetical protein